MVATNLYIIIFVYSGKNNNIFAYVYNVCTKTSVNNYTSGNNSIIINGNIVTYTLCDHNLL